MTARYLARSADGRALYGDEEGYVPLDAADPSLSSVADALPVAGSLPDLDEATAERRPAEHLSFASPLAQPGKLFGIGLNYADHASDLDEVRPDEPASFFKPATAATGPGGPIRLPPAELSDRVTAEAELGVVIGRTCRDVDEARVPEVVAGFVPIIDMTAEDVLQRNPRFLTRAKSFDTFLVLGQRIVVPDGGDSENGGDREPAIGALDDVGVRTVVDEEIIAENTIENMLFKPRELVAFHSRVMTLEPGDVISTGTPGAGVIRPGDAVRAEVDGVGTVRADVVR